MAKATRSIGTAPCDCQWDEHFTKRFVAGTVRHVYEQRFPLADLAAAGTSANGHIFLKCPACRAAHTTTAMVAALSKKS